MLLQEFWKELDDATGYPGHRLGSHFVARIDLIVGVKVLLVRLKLLHSTGRTQVISSITESRENTHHMKQGHR